MQFWPTLQRQAQKLADGLLRRGWPVDPDQIESDALDYVIDKVRALTDVRLLKEELKGGFFSLRSKAHKLVSRRKEVQPPDARTLLKQPDHRTQTIEELMEELGVPEHCRHLLVKAAYHQEEGDTVTKAMGAKEVARWRRTIQPQLQRWAEENGYRRAE